MTTLTTAAGLTPLMFETSFQAKFLIPMAVTLTYGLVFATALTLVIVPALNMIYCDFVRLFGAHPVEMEHSESEDGSADDSDYAISEIDRPSPSTIILGRPRSST